MSIEQEIAAWDGKSSDDIAVMYESHSKESSFSDEIVKFIKNTSYQKAATWLLKYYLESGNHLEKTKIKSIYNFLLEIENWETKLHILQSIPFMPISKNEIKTVEAFLRVSLTDSNKFIRAWAYNGFYEMAIQYPEYKNETKQFFEMAMRDEAASVKARIRNIIKKDF
ncbi:MAG: hypothetical protein HOM14_02150 [Gammaproteobacteria bacterium]|jgi:hypothetical protein|nr:hypothetical protein [Gammaproteobacteria bacterium]MBT3724695.1 hypothetical protein [Gammaproteobacteria bacterium]MBT4192800.1 hypothetical protein [Gammaproteobacteria bacterium]MBT4448721.1 hypothetical protein [Gammaproteobacteria bacterium]MBT4862605.1 hypothetical protein [Gammaproteobacteria bacterium]